MGIGKYTNYLMNSPSGYSWVKDSDVPEVSHDTVNRFLLSDSQRDLKLLQVVENHIDLQLGTLSVDDSTLDEPYSQTASTELIGYFCRENIKGISLILLVFINAITCLLAWRNS